MSMERIFARHAKISTTSASATDASSRGPVRSYFQLTEPAFFLHREQATQLKASSWALVTQIVDRQTTLRLVSFA